MLIYVKKKKKNVFHRTDGRTDGRTDRRTHVQLKTIVRNLTKFWVRKKKILKMRRAN